MTERPAFVRDCHLEFLDSLRKSGITNMYGAPPYLRNAYRILTNDQAVAVVSYWMSTFAVRHNLTDDSIRKQDT